MKKKLLILGMCAMMACAAVACGKDKDNGDASAGQVASAGEFDVEKTKADMKGTQYKSTIKLGEYKGLKIKEEDSVATAGEIDQAIQEILAGAAESTKLEEGTVESGDKANIDFVGKINGEAFDGGSGEGYDLGIGTGTFIEGFEEGLIGKKVGETVDLDLTFPKDYKDSEGNISEYAGKDVVFTVTINYITRSVLPELSDAFVKENCAAYDSTTVAELKEYLDSQIVKNKKLNRVWKDLLDATEITYDEDEIADLLEKMKTQLETSYAAYGMTLEDYCSYYNMTMKEFEADLDKEIRSSLKNMVIAMEIARKEGMEVTEEEYQEEIKPVLDAGSYKSEGELQQRYPKQDTVDSMLYYKTLEWVADQCVVAPDEEFETTTAKNE